MNKQNMVNLKNKRIALITIGKDFADVWYFHHTYASKLYDK